MRKTILIMGASANETPAIHTALALGLRTVVVDQNRNAPGFRVPGVIQEFSSIADVENMLRLAEKYAVDGVLTFVDAGIPSQAAIVKSFGLPGISEETARFGTDKTAMRQRLKERGIPIPAFNIVSTKDALLDAVSQFTERCVVKAPDQAGSRGIYLLKNVHDPDEVDYAWQYCMSFSHTGELLVEEFMEGPEICVETVSQKGVCYALQITDQLYKHPPYFTDIGSSQPVLYAPELQQQIRRIAEDANLALGNVNGSSNTEMILTAEGPKIIEVNMRPSGDFIATESVQMTTGINMSEAVIKIALGEPIDVAPTLQKGACVRYFTKERVGIIKAITGLEEAKKVPGVQELGTLKTVGDTACPLRKSSDRLAYVIAQGDTVEEAVQAADRALALIDFIVE